MVYRVFSQYGALLGAVLGVVLVLLGWLIDRTGVELPLLWMLLGASLILGFCFYRVGRSMSAQERVLEKVAVDSGASLREVQRYIQSLADGNYGESVSVDLDGQTATDLERFRSALVRENENKARLQWETQGLAQFSALLRGVQDLSAMSQDVVRFIVKYLNCNQGSFYRVKETDALYPVLELEACYAYDRVKHHTRTVDAGQGLLGQCYYEAQPILLYEVPPNYVSITSGWGMPRRGVF